MRCGQKVYFELHDSSCLPNSNRICPSRKMQKIKEFLPFGFKNRKRIIVDSFQLLNSYYLLLSVFLHFTFMFSLKTTITCFSKQEMIKAFSCDYEVNKNLIPLRKKNPSGHIRKTKHWTTIIIGNDRLRVGVVSADFLVWVSGKSEREFYVSCWRKRKKHKICRSMFPKFP